MTAGRTLMPGDWFGRGLPAGLRLGRDVYIDSAYGFDGVVSDVEGCVSLGEATGAYDRAALLVGPAGAIEVGAYTVLNGCTLVAESRITIGNHCLIAWGAVITDAWSGAAPVEFRRELLRDAHRHPDRWLAHGASPTPVVLGDNVWVGFDAVIMPGVTIGRGAVVSSRSVVRGDVPPYAVVAGDPVRIVRMLDPDDDEDARRRALAECTR
ncbi:hypothetical protein TBR22_A06580 [Luteitalea sp. TBR-22]|uniref:acyltransferase n=1 Tax=Luteitalea sp. TBR-22 TaxID=2802971 RepID=UPI001AF8335D|nr:acyltransferase [Luteitalea sp. TBR-22]BCS31457.1 hypothetical protein TBR22_A06580 [Luteitalea sp. TBR-22]